MNEIIRLCRGALLLDTQTFVDLKASADVFKRGFILVLVVGLIVGMIVAAADLYEAVTVPPLRERMWEAERGMEEGFEAMRQFVPVDPEMMEMIRQYARAGMGIGFRIAAIPTRLPKPVGGIFKALGTLVSTPFRWLSLLMFYGLLVEVFAKLLGGRGTIQEMLGLSCLAAAPHLADPLRILVGLAPLGGGCLTSLVGLAIFVWGAIIYVKAISVAQEFDIGRAILAFLLPILTAIFLLLVLVVVVVALIAR